MPVPPYPPCLCRPDAGGKVQSRSADTEARYRTRYVGMARRLGREHGCQEASIDQVVDYVAARTTTLRRVSFRQYRAAILQALRDLWDESAMTQERIEALEGRLRDVRPSEEETTGRRKSRKSPRTSAGRARSLSESRAACLVTALYAEGSDEARAAAGILEHGCDLGLRPSEWFGAEIVGRVLRCRSAKFSLENGRALAATRDIPLDDYDEGDVRLLTDHLATVRHVAEQAGTPELALRRMQGKLRKVRGPGWHDRICLYTGRHQYRANLAAAGVSRKEIAVRMGHASAATNGSHYASGRKGWRSAKLRKLAPIAPDLRKQVRPGARMKAKIAKGQPLTRMEARELSGQSMIQSM